MNAVPALPYAFARAHGVLRLPDADGHARVALRSGSDARVLAEVRRVVARPIAVERMDAPAFDRALSQAYAGAGLGDAADIDADALPESLDALLDAMPEAADLLASDDDAPVIRLINGVIAEGMRQGASDIHVEPYESALRVRLRVDGVMREVLQLPPRLAPMVVSRIKVMARLDIAEKRVPQDGRMSVALGARSFDVRVSTLPSRAGERVVLRILDKEQGVLALDELGMPPAVVAALGRALRQPNGIVLVTGPTGSGKTTTLYAAPALLRDGSRNILTVEDPVEYAVDGVGQTQVNAKVGMTFAAGLRAILRQDPDVVMVGEIRDPETAQIAVQASLTGHLVLSTVHTNDAIGAITRLRDMGVEPFLLGSTMRVVVAQRLVRRLCTACRAPRGDDALVAQVLGPGIGHRGYRAVGCAACAHTGYSGRVGVYEAVVVDDALRARITAGDDEDALARIAFDAGARLADAARARVLDGTTTCEEALRVARGLDADAGV